MCLVRGRNEWATALLKAGGGRRRARADRGWFGHALSIFWPAILRGSSTVARSDSMPADVVASETSVEGGVARGPRLFAAVLLQLVVGRWGGCRWRPATRRLHQ